MIRRRIYLYLIRNTWSGSSSCKKSCCGSFSVYCCTRDDVPFFDNIFIVSRWLVWNQTGHSTVHTTPQIDITPLAGYRDYVPMLFYGHITGPMMGLMWCQYPSSDKSALSLLLRNWRDRARMVLWFMSICTISANHHWCWRGLFNTTLCDSKVSDVYSIQHYVIVGDADYCYTA